jgi:hypothetical protein
MNERIKELSDIAYKNHLARNPHSSFGRRADYDREFAELIVRECSQMVHDSHPNDLPFVGGKMLVHFGVK